MPEIAQGSLVRPVVTSAREDALKAKSTIEQYFNRVVPPAAEIKRKVDVVYPPLAIWVIVGGGVLIAAAALTWALREFVPFTAPAGAFLALGGAALLLAGLVYRAVWKTERVSESKKPPTLTEQALQLIDTRIKTAGDRAVAEFGAPAPGARREILLGVGDRAWAPDLPFQSRERGADVVVVSLVDLMAVEVSDAFLTVRRYGLHLPTGTICKSWSTRRPLSDVLSAARRATVSVDSAAWTQADRIAKELAQLRRRKGAPTDPNIGRLEKELQSLALEQMAGEEFVVELQGGEKIVLTVAYKDADGAGKPARLVGGDANLKNAISIWDRINEVRVGAEAKRLEQQVALTSSAAATQKGVTEVGDGVKGVDAGIKDVGSGIGRVEQGLANFQQRLLDSVADIEKDVARLNDTVERGFAALPQARVKRTVHFVRGEKAQPATDGHEANSVPVSEPVAQQPEPPAATAAPRSDALKH